MSLLFARVQSVESFLKISTEFKKEISNGGDSSDNRPLLKVKKRLTVEFSRVPVLS